MTEFNWLYRLIYSDLGVVYNDFCFGNDGQKILAKVSRVTIAGANDNTNNNNDNYG